MEFLKQFVIYLIRFILLGGVATAGVFAGMVLRKNFPGKKEKKKLAE